MVNINNNFLKLKDNYLFSAIAEKVSIFKKINPEKHIINMGIGDVILPLPEVCIDAMQSAVLEMSKIYSFKGYSPYQGYEFLRNKISEYDYSNLDISPDEIFISDSAKSDVCRILNLFGSNNSIGILDPVYPVYVDSNIILGNSGEFNNSNNCFSNIVYLSMNETNNFIPDIPQDKIDIIYLCFPNNPTGAVLTKEQLKKWVDYALDNNSIILFDSAYEAFITDPNIPHSIYEIDNAKKVAIEFKSFSKTAGFTGLRCAYTVIPEELELYNKKLIDFYRRLLSTTFNGVSYITQKAAESLYTPDGILQVNKNINYYLNNADIIKNKLKILGIKFWGGENSPYIWMKIPDNIDSWKFFDILLEKANIIGTPGCGFGPSGEGYFRLTAFNTLENTIEAMNRFEYIFK